MNCTGVVLRLPEIYEKNPMLNRAGVWSASTKYIARFTVDITWLVKPWLTLKEMTRIQLKQCWTFGIEDTPTDM